MALLVLAYPQIEKKDYDWIQSVRAKHDQRYFHIVEPHFTIVFPVLNVEEDEFIRHIKKVTKQFKEFYFVLRCAQIVKDSFSDYTDGFLIPEEGYRIFVKLHDALYTDILEQNLRLDIPFIPHVGIASNIDPRICKSIADDINNTGIEIIGAVSRVSVVSYENNKVSSLKEIYL
jgi:hypothetical protein